VTKLRYMGETHFCRSCYLRVTAGQMRDGALPDVRSGRHGLAQPGGAQLNSVIPKVGQSVINGYDDVIEGVGDMARSQRNGVDMVWANASYGHIGPDLTGPNGAASCGWMISQSKTSPGELRDMPSIVDDARLRHDW
jgi:hypothetical protein